MESRKANLMIDVAKNVVEQYREQLANFVEKSKTQNLTRDQIENKIERPERTIKLVDQILNNFEKSVFDGEVTDEATCQRVFDKDHFITKTINYYEEFAPTKENKEEREIGMVENGIERVFKQIGIPTYAIYPVVADLTCRYREENYVHGIEEMEKFARIDNDRFNKNGKYEVGELAFNNVLTIDVTADTGILIERTEKHEPILYSLYEPFILNSLKIKEIVDKYLDNEINRNKIDNLDEQNMLLHSTFDFLRYTGNRGGGDSANYSHYYYEYYKSLFRYGHNGGDKYLKTPRNIINKDMKINDTDTLASVNEQIEELQTEKTKKEEKIKMLNELLETMHSLQEQNQLLDEQINELMSKLNGKTL